MTSVKGPGAAQAFDGEGFIYISVTQFTYASSPSPKALGFALP
jgi:hypothetical protein